ncbi:MAG: hypothetical protein M3R63_03320 [Actinomycetota bacterium]|nr:hypothetical protein [Actinomycetota bacterium]
MVLPAGLVVISALANAAALVLLHKAAMAEPAAPSFSLVQLWVLLRRPIWASGMAMIVVGFALQAAALAVGAVSLVQLVLVLELPFTLILSGLVLGGALRLREWTAIAAMTIGLVLALVSLMPRGGDPYSTGLTVWIVSATATVALITLLVFYGRRRARGGAKAAWYGVATGIVAVLVKAVVSAASAGTRLLTGGDGTVRVWDAISGLPVGFTIVTLPGGELAVFDAIADQLVRASAGAWRWLGWNVVEDGRLTRLPAESFGPLPPLHPAARSAEPARGPARRSR